MLLEFSYYLVQRDIIQTDGFLPVLFTVDQDDIGLFEVKEPCDGFQRLGICLVLLGFRPYLHFKRMTPGVIACWKNSLRCSRGHMHTQKNPLLRCDDRILKRRHSHNSTYSGL